MTLLFIYLAALVGLVAVLIMIASKTLAMVREGSPLVAVGGLQWNAALPRAQPKPQPRQPAASAAGPAKAGRFAGLRASLNSRLRPAARVTVEPNTEAPPRERSRRLASLSEVRAAELGIDSVVPSQLAADFAAGIEPRIEAELDRLCDGTIDLPAFTAFVAAQQVELDRYLAIVSDADTRATLDTAGTIIAFSRDWISQQQ